MKPETVSCLMHIIGRDKWMFLRKLGMDRFSPFEGLVRQEILDILDLERRSDWVESYVPPGRGGRLNIWRPGSVGAYQRRQMWNEYKRDPRRIPQTKFLVLALPPEYHDYVIETVLDRADVESFSMWVKQQRLDLTHSVFGVERYDAIFDCIHPELQLSLSEYSLRSYRRHRGYPRYTDALDYNVEYLADRGRWPDTEELHDYLRGSTTFVFLDDTDLEGVIGMAGLSTR